MKKIFIIFALAAMLFVIVNGAFAQVRPVDTTLKAVDGTGAALATGSAVTVQVVICHPQRMTNGAVFSYYGIDTGTGYGINIFANTAGADSTFLTAYPPGLREGLFVQVTGVIAQFNGNIEVDFTAGGNSAITTLGTGFGHATTLIPSLSAFTVFNQNLQTGGEFYEGRLVRINNVHVVGLGSFSSLSVSDFSGANVLINSASTPFFTTFTTNNPSYFSTVTAPGYTFDFIGVAVQQAGLPGPYIFQMRYLITDFVSTTVTVSPPNASSTPSGPTIQFNASGGMPPYTWSLSTTSVGTINPTTGLFTPGASAGSATVRATDAIGRIGGTTVFISATSAPLATDSKDVIQVHGQTQLKFQKTWK